MTVDEFLEWEERQPLRYEFDGWDPVAMTGGTLAHELIVGNLRGMLRDRLRGKRCQAVGPTMKVEVAGRIRYPDAFVFCNPVPNKATVIQDPVVVFEVISPGTSRTDRLEKLREYQATPSIQHYVVLEQDSIGAMVFARDGAQWATTTVIEGETLAFPEIGVELPISDIYDGIDLPPLEET